MPPCRELWLKIDAGLAVPRDIVNGQEAHAFDPTSLHIRNCPEILPLRRRASLKLLVGAVTGRDDDQIHASVTLMPNEVPSSSIVKVLVATPLGRGGKGGIDRMVDAIREEARLKASSRVRLNFCTTRGPHYVLSPVYLFSSILKLVFMRFRSAIDVLHVNLSSNSSTYRKIILVTVAEFVRVPYVVHLHSGEFREFWDSRGKAMRFRIQALFERAERVVVLGRVWRDAISERAPGASGRIVIIPNATRAPPDLAQSREANKILFLGRLNEAKGVSDLLNALNQLKDLQWTATLAGDGEVEATKAAVQLLELSDRVSVPGWADDATVRDLLSASAILVLPSHVENLPMCVVEAFGYGLSVVCTPVGAIPEIVEHEVTGLLVPPRSPEHLAAAIKRLLSDPELASRLGTNARAKHDADLNISAYFRHLEDLWCAASKP